MTLSYLPGLRWPLFGITLLASLRLAPSARGAGTTPPPDAPRNIIYILADDLGWGSLGCYGATKVKTPNLDRLASEGIRFTDAYAPSSVCSPSRYAVMTGRFFWRTTNDCEVLENDAPFHTGLDKTTAPGLLKAAGYKTACIGKWHLGLGNLPKTDWNIPLQPGPLEAGFDYFYGMPANIGNPPDIYVENHGVSHQDPNSRIVWTGGRGENAIYSGITEIRDPVQAGPRFNQKAIEFIEQSKNVPFFLYYTPNEVHDPVTPTPQFQGTSQAGPYGDFIQQLDFEVGQILKTLDRLGLAKNTLILFSSDNGGVIVAGPRLNTTPEGQAQKMGFSANGPLRGGKHSDFEGGFRVPFIARWPGHIPAGVVSDAIINLCDFTATAAALTRQPIPPLQAEDSFNILPVLLNKTTETKDRDYTASLSAMGNFGIRSGVWKYIEKRIDANFTTRIRLRNFPDQNAFQLYNLSLDIRETNNLYYQDSDVSSRLQGYINQCRDNARSHPVWSESTQDDPNN